MAPHTQQLTAAPAVRLRGLTRSFEGRTRPLWHRPRPARRTVHGPARAQRFRQEHAAAGHRGPGRRGRRSGPLTAPERVSVVFQDSRLLPWRRVLDNVLLGTNGKEAADKGREALAEVGLKDRERAWPNELSGGEAQRAALARSLVRAQLLLADEPSRWTR